MNKFLSLLGFLFPWSLLSQNLTPELLATLPKVGDPAISPDGKLVVYALDQVNLADNKGDKDLYLISNLGGQTKKIAGGKGGQFAPKWISNEEVAYLNTAEGAPQVWKTNVRSGLSEQVSKIDGGIGDFEITSEGKLVYLADVKTTKDVHDIYPDLPKVDARIIDDLFYRHWDSWDDYNNTHVFISEKDASGFFTKGKDLMDKETFDAEEFAVSPNGQKIAYTSKKLNGKAYAVSTNTDIYLFDVKSGKTDNLTNGNMGYDRNPVFSHDGKKLAYTSMATAGFESDKATLIVYNLEEGTKTDLTQHSEESVSNMNWSVKDDKIFYISGTQASYQVFEVNVANETSTQITKGYHDYKSLVLGNNELMGVRVSMTEPAEIYKIWPDGKEIKLTTETDAIWNKIPKAKVEKHMVKTSDGKDMLVWMVLPPDFDPTKKYPALLYCQGGPQSAVSQFFSTRWNFQMMASKGYIVVAPNRRGLPTFGKEWNDEISGDWGGQAIQDYLSAIDFAAKMPYVNKDKLGAVGASYGGYSVYKLAGVHNKRFKALIAHCGLFNLESWYGSTEELFFANKDIGGPYWTKPQPGSYEKFSPHKFVQNWDAPILVIHGEKDFRVPISEGMQAFQAAQIQNIPSRFLYFPDEGHWILKPQNAVLWNRVFFDWLDKYLK